MKKLVAMLICAMTVTAAAHAASHEGSKGGMMYARMTSGSLKPGTADQVAAIFRDDIVPAVKKEPGYQGFYVMTNQDDFVVIAMWESEEAMTKADETGLHKVQLAKVKPLFAGKPTVQFYDVDVAEMAHMGAMMKQHMKKHKDMMQKK